MKSKYDNFDKHLESQAPSAFLEAAREFAKSKYIAQTPTAFVVELLAEAMALAAEHTDYYIAHLAMGEGITCNYAPLNKKDLAEIAARCARKLETK